MSTKQHPISPAQFIRQQALRMKRQEFAEGLGVTPTIISRYEREGRIPDRHRDRVLSIAKKRGVKINPKWFESVPWDPKMRVPA